MKDYELTEVIDELSGMVISEMGSVMLDFEDEDVLKALKVMKLAKKVIVEQNKDIEELKSKIWEMDMTLDKILYEVSEMRRNREKA